jgi:predicted nucleic acid-binding protein
MRSLVIDGSTTVGLLLPDERATGVTAASRAMERGIPTYVPVHWWVETANALLMAERRKRATQANINESLLLVRRLPVITDDETAQRSGVETFSLARQYELTIYDAAYLELALRKKSSLATSDKALARAATLAGVTVLA